MKKLFHNSTKGNDTQNQASKSKRKFLKTFSFTSLALLMGIAGTMAFAPLGTSPSVANANEIENTTTSGLGLDPKKDPIVYTTESGLEIRMSNATQYTGTSTFTTNYNTSYTQNISSFYYFTMGAYSGTIYTAANNTTTANYTVSSSPVNWIIIGLGANTGYFLDTVSANLFSTWKTNIENVNNNYTNKTVGGAYFFQNIFENTTPAGAAINGVLPSKSYVMEKVKASISVNPGNLNEIPSGCMLVISEKMLGQMAYTKKSNPINKGVNLNTELNHYIIYSSEGYGSRYRYIGNSNLTASGTQSWTTSGNAGGCVYNYINELFSKNTSGTILKNGLGFTQAQSDLIVPQQLYTNYHNGSSYQRETPSTDGGTYYTMFPLAYKSANSGVSQSFCIETYLTSNTVRLTSLIGSTQAWPQWLRSGVGLFRAGYVHPNGSLGNFNLDCSFGVRPAMVMKLK